jgi:hypothetical protein
VGDGLAVQIRQNTRSMRASTYQSITSHIADPNAALTENPEVIHLVATGEADPSLKALPRAIYH